MQSNILLIALLLYPVSNFLEAWLEVVVIRLKNPALPDYRALNKKEHFRSAVYAVVICAMAAISALAMGEPALIPAILVNRRLVFDYGLKHLRNRQFDRYEGDGYFDTIGRRLFGEEGAHKEFLLLIIITTLSISLACR